MWLIEEFNTIFGEALQRFANENEIGKSKNSILIFPDNDTDEMQLQFAYCMDTDDGLMGVAFINWALIYGSDDFIMNRNMMMAQFFLQAFIRMAREYDCNVTDVGIMVMFQNDDSEKLTLFAYNKFDMIIDKETKRKKIISIDEMFMDVTD